MRLRLHVYSMPAALLVMVVVVIVSLITTNAMAMPLLRRENLVDGQAAAASASASASTSASLSIDVTQPLVNVSKDLWGVFFEEINHAGVAGLYSQLLNNSNFEIASQKFEQDDAWHTTGSPRMPTYGPWFLLPPAANQDAWIGLNQDFPLNGWNSYSIYVKSTGAAGTTTLVNPGFWGINTIGVSTFTVSFYALVPQGVTAPTHFTVSVYSNKTGAAYASGTIPVELTTSWQKFTTTFSVSTGTDSAAYFSISWATTSETVVYFDVITLYPDDGWNGLPYIRKDLGDMVAALHPSFMRFPGGCYVEGGVLNDRFNWKNTIGPIENRRGHWGIWYYYTEDQLGVFEFFSFIEKLTDVYGNPTRAIWVINSGNAHMESVPPNELGQYVQDALDSIEFIIGPATSRWGSVRAAMGHPEPFTSLSHVAIGNEGNFIADWTHTYLPNYGVLYAALKAAYPHLTYVSNGDLTSYGYTSEVYDFHLYEDTPYKFFNVTTQFDSYNRTGPKVFNSEYAVYENCGQGNAIGALSEAAWMTGLERNSDLVTTAAYAPLFVNVNDRAWNVDAIVFDNYRAFGTPSYWTQWMFSNSYQGTVSGTMRTLTQKFQVPSIAALSTGDGGDVPSLFAMSTWGQLNASMAVEKSADLVVVIKVVNADTNNTVPIAIDLSSAAKVGASVNPVADVWTLAATSPTQENSFDNPLTVAPAVSTFTIPSGSGGNAFTFTFAPLSTTIVRVYLKL